VTGQEKAGRGWCSRHSDLRSAMPDEEAKEGVIVRFVLNNMRSRGQQR